MGLRIHEGFLQEAAFPLDLEDILFKDQFLCLLILKLFVEFGNCRRLLRRKIKISCRLMPWQSNSVESCPASVPSSPHFCY